MAYIQAISSILNFHKIFGYVPIKLKKNFSNSYLTFVQGSFLLTSFTILLIFDNLTPEDKTHKINLTINRIKLVCSATNIFVNVIFTWINVQCFKNMLIKLCKLLNKFKTMGIFVEEKKANRFGWFAIILSVIILTTLGIISWLLNMDASNKPQRFIVLFAPLVFNNFILTQICVWCFLFKQCFDGLNKIVEFRLRNMQFTDLNKSLNSIHEKSRLYNNLDELGQAYFSIQDIIADFSKIYAFQNLAVFATSFTVLTCFLYYIIYVPTGIEDKIYLLSWIIFISSEIVVNVFMHHSVVEKVKNKTLILSTDYVDSVGERSFFLTLQEGVTYIEAVTT